MTVVDSLNWGDLAFDPSPPIDDANARIDSTALAFTRALSAWPDDRRTRSCVPVVGGDVEGCTTAKPPRRRFGLGDSRVRLAINLYGAPSMTPAEFVAVRHGTSSASA